MSKCQLILLIIQSFQNYQKHYKVPYHPNRQNLLVIASKHYKTIEYTTNYTVKVRKINFQKLLNPSDNIQQQQFRYISNQQKNQAHRIKKLQILKVFLSHQQNFKKYITKKYKYFRTTIQIMIILVSTVNIFLFNIFNKAWVFNFQLYLHKYTLSCTNNKNSNQLQISQHNIKYFTYSYLKFHTQFLPKKTQKQILFQ
eukprot:TRINITY_DN7869_c1_g1_i1.p1 TRINITY_DN7869_c1_g1~~TRINITY_DN7869_c1_g1_i1.p1  ORF type:complete len:223 (-),score=-19.45 TRINITY_DN7869_c1_g1_i1:355-948(-)